MPTVTVKNIPTDLYESLKQSAQANRRSINSEIIVCIERAVGYHKVEPQAILASARRLREKTANYVITDDELMQAKTEGRP
jgi:hypothetical protein